MRLCAGGRTVNFEGRFPTWIFIALFCLHGREIEMLGEPQTNIRAERVLQSLRSPDTPRLVGEISSD